jgi:hypothetical protein
VTCPSIVGGATPCCFGDQCGTILTLVCLPI